SFLSPHLSLLLSLSLSLLYILSVFLSLYLRKGFFVLKLHKATPIPSLSENIIEETVTSTSVIKESQPLISAMSGYWDTDEETSCSSAFLSVPEKENLSRGDDVSISEAAGDETKGQSSNHSLISFNGKITPSPEIKDLINLEALSTGLFKPPEGRIAALKVSVSHLLMGSTMKYANIMDIHSSVYSQHMALMYIPKSFYILPLGGQTRLLRNLDVPFVAKLMASLHPLLCVSGNDSTKLSFEPSDFSENATVKPNEGNEENSLQDASIIPSEDSLLDSPTRFSSWKPQEEGILLWGGDKRVALTEEMSCFILGDSTRLYFLDLMESTETSRSIDRKNKEKFEKFPSSPSHCSAALPSEEILSEIPPPHRGSSEVNRNENRRSQKIESEEHASSMKYEGGHIRVSQNERKRKTEDFQSSGIERSKKRASRDASSTHGNFSLLKERYYRHSKYTHSNYSSLSSRDEEEDGTSPIRKKSRVKDTPRDDKRYTQTMRSPSPEDLRHRRRATPDEGHAMRFPQGKETPSGSSSSHPYGSSYTTRKEDFLPSDGKHRQREAPTRDRRIGGRRPSSLSPPRDSQRFDKIKSKENRRREKFEGPLTSSSSHTHQR
ncbi:hypothetical protein IE077_001870, partial [Cardiosporidium cionae]